MIIDTIIVSPVVFSIHVLEEELPAFEAFLYSSENSVLCSDRVFVAAYVSENNSFFHSNYPINILRNIGVRNVETSHFLLLDADMMLSENAYSELMALPESIYRANRTAIVIPSIFSRTYNTTGSTLESQLQTALQTAPKTMEDLRTCILGRRCMNRKGSLFTHVGDELPIEL